MKTLMKFPLIACLTMLGDIDRIYIVIIGG